uniref:Uncharacterized protein n=3 Tax=Photinus pyralis TaxID=7054 RepID=A0A1Y1MW08_PHOPY
MNVLRDIYQNISPAAATDLPPPPPPPLDPHRWHEPSNPQELAMVSMRCLEQMLPIVETKHRDSQLLTERLERELTASRTQQQHLFQIYGIDAIVIVINIVYPAANFPRL